MIDIVTNNVRQIGTPADEGRVYISEKAYKMIKGESFRDREVYVYRYIQLNLSGILHSGQTRSGMKCSRKLKENMKN